MKIAVYYSGFVRSFLETFENHKSNFLDLYDCEIFCHFWDNWGFGRMQEKYETDNDILSSNERKSIINLINSSNVFFEDYKSMEVVFDNMLKDNIKEFPFCKNVLSMHYKIKKSFELIENSNNEYDVYFRMRPDHYLMKKIEIKDLKENSIFTSKTPARSNNGGVNDQIAYGNKKTMKEYSSFFDNWTLLNNNRRNCNPEIILGEYLKYKKIEVLDDPSLDHWILNNDNTLR